MEKEKEVKKEEIQKVEEQKSLTIPDFKGEITQLVKTSGSIKLTDEQKKILYAPVNEEDIEIRPDGLIYLPWMEYVSRLREAFGLEWSIIPQDMPKFDKNTGIIYWGWYLVIQSKLAGFAIGEQQYHPDNPRMTYGDACEGAKSNALMRLCKGLGISLELWKPSFIRRWKERYAESYIEKGRPLWRKKNSMNQTETTDLNPQLIEKTEQVLDETPINIKEEKGNEAKRKALIPWIHSKASHLGIPDDVRKKTFQKGKSCKDMTYDELNETKNMLLEHERILKTSGKI